MNIPKISRVWAMPNKWTYQIKPIAKLLEEIVGGGEGWADPFAGLSTIAEYRNDLNPERSQPYQVDATAFIEKLPRGLKGVLFDPPYSMEQIKRSYAGVGVKGWQTRYGNNKAGNFAPVKDRIAEKLSKDGLVISFGWNTSGMGKKRGFEIIANGNTRHVFFVTTTGVEVMIPDRFMVIITEKN